MGAALENGDFNGDGYDELVVARPEHNFLRGAFDVMTGSSDGLGIPIQFRTRWALDTLDVYPPAICNPDGGPDLGRPCEELEAFATALASGDFNNDGFMDLAVGSPGRHVYRQDLTAGIVEPDYNIPRAGAVNVIYGSPDGLVAETDQDWQQNLPALPTEPITPANNSAVLIGGAETPGPASTPLAVAWNESVDPDSMDVTYEWQLSSTETFDDTLGSFDAGSLNQLIVTHGQLALVMNAAGVQLDEAVSWYHRIVAHDPVAGTPGPALSLTLVRGQIVSNSDDEIPAAASLMEIYPNPVSGASTASIHIKDLDFATVYIHDVRGALIQTLAWDEAASGKDLMQFSVSGLPPGVYFVSVDDGSLRRTGKLAVLP